jgi:hypothetical protein
MKLLIFKTDIKTKKMVKAVKPILNNNSVIVNWSIDTKDIDNVLRIEASENLNEDDIIDLIKPSGFGCEILMD